MLQENSTLMQFFRLIKCESLAWSLRRLWCPVPGEALVLEVGSGGNPYFRANVLLDAYEETRERHWQPLVKDRPTVLGFVERLPFRDKCFDFVIASHVLEHSNDPEAFLSELQRVAKAGYIEVPDALMERINPYHDHRLEITQRDSNLLIRKKADWQTDPELVELYEDRVKPVITGETMRKHPFHFHVRYYWQNKINFDVLNPEVDVNWQPEVSNKADTYQPGLKARMKEFVLVLARKLLSQTQRNRQLDLQTLLLCPSCGHEDLEITHSIVKCSGCSREFTCRDGIPVMIMNE